MRTDNSASATSTHITQRRSGKSSDISMNSPCSTRFTKFGGIRGKPLHIRIGGLCLSVVIPVLGGGGSVQVEHWNKQGPLFLGHE